MDGIVWFQEYVYNNQLIAVNQLYLFQKYMNHQVLKTFPLCDRIRYLLSDHTTDFPSVDTRYKKCGVLYS